MGRILLTAVYRVGVEQGKVSTLEMWLCFPFQHFLALELLIREKGEVPV